MKARAFVTVETALIMPMVVLVIVFILCIGFYEHDTAVFIEKTFFAARDRSMYEENNLLKRDVLEDNSVAAVNISINNNESITENSAESKANVRLFIMGKALQIHSRQDYAKCYAPSMIRLVNVGLSIKDTVLDRK